MTNQYYINMAIALAKKEEGWNNPKEVANGRQRSYVVCDINTKERLNFINNMSQ